MIPLVDIHCHLLASLDDGPRTEEDALKMCRIAFEDGTQMIAAGAHQSDDWPSNNPERILQAAQRLEALILEKRLPLTTFPCAEVMVQPDIVEAWKRKKLLSVANRGQYLLIELPHGLYIDLREIIEDLVREGVRPILAHPERSPELLHGEGLIEDLIRVGCLVQVSANSITQATSRRDERALKNWLQRGVVHFLGSDGHSPRRRLPKMADAYRSIINCAGVLIADRVCSSNGMNVVNGLRLSIPNLIQKHKSWFRIW